MITKRILLTLLAAFLLLPASLSAQAPEQNREQWFGEMRQYKHAFLAKELNLNQEQQNKFFPLYDDMEDQTQKIAEETRAMQRRIASQKDDVSDLEYEKAADALYEQNLKEAQIEMEFFQKFKPILTKKQLFQLKDAERRFHRTIMRKHQSLKAGSKK